MNAKVEYFNEKARRATFKSWVFKSNVPCNADMMAEAGFIFSGSSREPDAAQCFFCKKALDGWEHTDDPWKEHLKHGLNCDFARMQKAQDDWTLSEWQRIKQKYEENLIKENYQRLHDKTKKTFSNLRLIINKPQSKIQ